MGYRYHSFTFTLESSKLQVVRGTRAETGTDQTRNIDFFMQNYTVKFFQDEAKGRVRVLIRNQTTTDRISSTRNTSLEFLSNYRTS